MEEKDIRGAIFRQVQIIAGILILMGMIGGYFYNPDFYFLSVFVGIMLVFAGVTGICFMSMLLAIMPWNRPQ